MILGKRKIYILFIRVFREKGIIVGSLGRITFKRGTYLYIGGAKTNLLARITRHYRKEKRIFWHIDYLLSRKGVKIKEVWTGNGLTECKLAKKISLLPSSRLLKRGFGSSDCKCPGHFFYMSRESRVKTLLKELNFGKHIMGEVIGVCTSKEKEKPKKNIGKGYLKKGYGLIGDAHGGTEKEVSLLALEDACPVRSNPIPKGTDASPMVRTSNGVKKRNFLFLSGRGTLLETLLPEA